MWFQNIFNMPVAPGGLDKKSMKRLAKWENNQAYQDVFIWLTNMWLSLFEWKNLPDTCNERALEYTLLFYGKALFFRDDEPLSVGEYPIINEGDGHYWHTPVILGPGLNIYYEHTKMTAYSYQYNKQFDITNSVLIRNNSLMADSLNTLMLMTRRLVQAMRTIEALADHYKNPYIIRMDETEIKSWELYEQQRSEFQTSVFTSKSFNPDAVSVIPTGVSPGMLKDLWDHYHNLENYVFTRFGLNNANTEKRERLITAEVEANNGVIDMSVEPMLLSRQRACELINDMFGLDLEVKLRNKKEDEQDGELYADPLGISKPGPPPV